jgi:hypothetical protein
MTSKIKPGEEVKEVKEESVRKTVMYCGYEISDDDTDEEFINKIIENKRPSDITDNTNYETDSDSSGYNENAVGEIHKRQPTFIRNSINNFSKRVVDSNGTTKQTLGSSVFVPNKTRPCCSIRSILCCGFI